MAKTITHEDIQNSLKPCPFCEQKPLLTIVKFNANFTHTVSACIICTFCGIEADFEQDPASRHEFKRLLPWEQWNTRAEVQNG